MVIFGEAGRNLEPHLYIGQDMLRIENRIELDANALMRKIPLAAVTLGEIGSAGCDTCQKDIEGSRRGILAERLRLVIDEVELAFDIGGDLGAILDVGNNHAITAPCEG